MPKQYLQNVKLTPQIDTNNIKLEVETNITEKNIEELNYYIETEISFNGQILNITKELINNNYQEIQMNISQNNKEHIIQKWSPNNPNLYYIVYKLYCEDKIIDTVYSYFGMREISIEADKILLNKEPIYLKSILDQGYWKESHLTPPNEESIIKDIDSILELGYNAVRKHQKIEDERFLYWCDVKGVFVWSEMGNCYEFNDKSLQAFTEEWIKVVKQHYNHPSIITWVPINESWGVPNVSTDEKQQNFINSLYYLTKALDSTRPVISNDGWEHTISDIITIHDYKQEWDILSSLYKENIEKVLNNEETFNGKHKAFAKGYSYNGKPIIMSEYGGIAINSDKGWGYGKQVKDEEEFIERFSKLTQVIQSVPSISGYCFTQLTDVQQEINGLMDEERNYKIEPSIIKNINNKR